MKTTIALAAILLAVSPFATAEDISLVIKKDFNSDSRPSYDSDLKVGENGCSYKVTGSSLPQYTVTGVDTSSGFTVAINALYNLNYSDPLCTIWIKDSNETEHPYVINFDIDTKKYDVKKESSGNEVFAAVGVSDTSELTKKEWYSLFLTVEDVAEQEASQYTLTTMSMDGTVVSTTSGILTGDNDEAVSGSLTKINLGNSSFGTVNTSRYTLRADNFGVYNGVLSTEQMQEVTLYEVANSTMPESVKSAAPTPEPSTATLSLLALAALAARRRRH